MATYLQYPDIQGTVDATNYQHWIACDDIHFKLHRQIHQTNGCFMDRDTSRPTVSLIYITKQLDQSSVGFFHEVTSSKAKNQAIIHYCQTNHAQNPYVSISLSEVMVSQYELSNHVEKLALSFERIEIRFTPYDEDNQPQSPLSSFYDLKTATSA